MRRNVLFSACVAVAACVGMLDQAAADSVVQLREFSFPLDTQVAGVPVDNGFFAGTPTYTGEAALAFDPFDTSLGNLVRVQLDLAMNVNGTVFFAPPRPQYYQLAAAYDPYNYADISISGTGTAGDPDGFSLNAIADFGEYEYGVDGAVVDDTLVVDSSGEGSDATTNAADFSSFTNFQTVLAGVAAQFMLDYTNSGGAGNAGNAGGLLAQGDLTLTYVYATDDVPVVPTPAALPAGLAMLGLLWLRRWWKA